MPTKQQLSDQAAQLASEIRTWSLSQIHLWQQLPNLALEADGRTGYSADLGVCYGTGLWRSWHNSPRGGYLKLSVDCATGRLVSEPSSRSRQELTAASDEAVLWLATRLDEIDAAAIISALTAQAQTPRPSWYSEEEWQLHERQRASTRERYGLGYGIPYARRRTARVSA